MENNTLCNRHSLGVNNHTKMYVTYTRIYGWSDYGGESSYQPGYRLENMMWMTLLVYDYIIPGGSNVIAFMSPAGGTGTSSMAAACAMQCAGRGNNVLYLNLEKFGSSDVFFSGEGQFTMSDIIFALKGRKANLAMKLQSCVKKATCGGDFFSTSQTALDIDRDICWGHFCRWLNHIKTLFTLKKCCDHKAFCKQK